MDTLKDIDDFVVALDDAVETRAFCLPDDSFWLWPQVRYRFFKLLQDKVINKEAVSGQPAASAAVTRGSQGVGRLSQWMKIFSRDPLSVSGNINAVLFSSTLASDVDENGNAYNRINSLFDGVEGLAPYTVYYTQRGKLKPRYSGLYGFADALITRAAIRRKLMRHKLEKRDRKIVDDLCVYLVQASRGVLTNDDVRGIRKSLYQFAVERVSLRYVYKKFLVKASPRFIAIEDGNYGGADRTMLIRLAKELNITTIEVQHGIFDIAYKYGSKSLANGWFREYNTDLVFSYGKYWNEYACMSSTVVDTGYPYLLSKYETVKKQALPAGGKPAVLVVSQGKNTAALMAIVERAYPEIAAQHRIIIRLHPAESANLDRYRSLAGLSGVEFSTGGSIYELINEAAYIVGSFSFVLFEALLFNKAVLIHRNEFSEAYIPSSLGKWFVNEAELIHTLNDASGASQSGIDYFWTTNVRKRLTEVNSKFNLW